MSKIIMIIVRSPLRISLGGGGTDFPSYYLKFGGELITAAIDKYVYITLTKPFYDGIYLKYSELEKIHNINDIKHPIFRETFKLLAKNEKRIEITTLADIPSGTGLGSSGSFTTALIGALTAYQNKYLDKKNIANLACDIEINKLNQPIGKQDQFIASYGGFNNIIFQKNNIIKVKSMNISEETRNELEDNLLLFYTGISRSANEILQDQVTKSEEMNNSMLSNLNYIKNLGIQSKHCLEKGNMKDFSRIMIEHWNFKKDRSQGMTNSQIDSLYELGMSNGALGGKLVGAGGGGFIMFYVEDKNKLRKAMKLHNKEEVRFKLDYDGTKVILRS